MSFSDFSRFCFYARILLSFLLFSPLLLFPAPVVPPPTSCAPWGFFSCSALFSFCFLLTRCPKNDRENTHEKKKKTSKTFDKKNSYVGYEEGGQLTEAVRRRPYSVVLFDEVEKAHADVFNVLLQILDDGRVTDSQGRVVNFKNTLIILTSNLGSGAILDALDRPDLKSEDLKDEVMAMVRSHFRPEFINRVDEFVVFEALRRDQVAAIVKLQVERVQARLAPKKIALSLEDSAVEYLSAIGYDPVFGARPVKRAVQRELETGLAKALLRGDFGEEDTVSVSAPGGAKATKLVFEAVPRDAAAPSSSSSGKKPPKAADVPA